MADPDKVFIGPGPTPLGDPATFIEGLSAMFDGHKAMDVQELAKMPEGKRVAVAMQRQAKAFTVGVDFLRRFSQFPNKAINNIAKDLWNLCNNQIVRCTMMPSNPVVSLSFVYMKQKDGREAGMLLLPPNYENQLEQARFYTLGGIVFCGAQVRDFYNGKLVAGKQQDCVDRAKMYEAEFLLVGQRMKMELNAYQRKILEEFPKGLDSRPDLAYTPILTPTATDKPPPNV